MSASFGRVKQLVADFLANEKFCLFPACLGHEILDYRYRPHLDTAFAQNLRKYRSHRHILYAKGRQCYNRRSMNAVGRF